MAAIHPQYVVDEQQRRQAVLLPLSDWEQIVEELEELDDIRAYDQAKSEAQESINFDDAVREIEQERDE